MQFFVALGATRKQMALKIFNRSQEIEKTVQRIEKTTVNVGIAMS